MGSINDKFNINLNKHHDSVVPICIVLLANSGCCISLKLWHLLGLIRNWSVAYRLVARLVGAGIFYLSIPTPLRIHPKPSQLLHNVIQLLQCDTVATCWSCPFFNLSYEVVRYNILVVKK
jgi:hypothetical protein